MDEKYPANSDKAREKANKPEKEKEAKPKGQASIEEGGASKFFKSFISSDADSIKDYLIYGVLIPDTKRAIEEVIHMALHGGRTSGRRDYHTNYESRYDSRTRRTRYDERDKRRPEDREEERSNRRSSSKVTKVRCDDRFVADDILTRIEDYVYEYELISVAKMCEIADMESLSTDGRYGWTSNAINKVEKRIISGDWYLIFPKPLPID